MKLMEKIKENPKQAKAAGCGCCVLFCICCCIVPFVLIFGLWEMMFGGMAKVTGWQLDTSKCLGKPHGKLDFPDSNYWGCLESNLPQGFGRKTWKDGSVYTGDFNLGLRSG